MKEEEDMPMKQENRHHFLYHIFRMDKAENPMPGNRALPLRQLLKQVFQERGEKSGKE